MSKKKKYFLSNELSSIIESSSDRSLTFNLSSTATDSSSVKPIRRMPKPATPGTALKRIYKSPQSNLYIQELEDRCLIKLPKKKISFSEDSTSSKDTSSIDRSQTESYNKKKSQPTKCRVISVFGKKCPPPPLSVKSPKSEEKKTKARVDFSEKVNTEIDRLANLLKTSASNLKKYKRDSANTTTTTVSSVSISPQNEKALVLRPALTVSKYQQIKKVDLSRNKSLRVKKQPLRIKSPESVDISKNSSNSSLESAIDIEIEKLVALLNETKEILGSKLAKKNSMLTSTPKHSSTESFKRSKSSSKMNKEENKESLPHKINREIEKIAILFKDPPPSIIEKFRSIDKRSSKKAEKSSENNTKTHHSETSCKRKKEILLLKIDLAEPKGTLQKVKKSSSTSKSLEPTNLKKEIKLFKQEKEKEKESLMSKVKSHLKEKLDFEKFLTSRKQIKSKEATKPSLTTKATSETATSKKYKEEKPTLVVSLKECIKPKNETLKFLPLPLPPPPPPVVIKTPKLETRLHKSKEAKVEPPKLKEKSILNKIESTIRDEQPCTVDTKSITSKRSIKSAEKEKSTTIQETSTLKSNESNKIIITKEPKKINDSFKKVSSARRKFLSILNKKVPIIPAKEANKQDDVPVIKTESKVIVLPPIEPSPSNSPDIIIKQKIKHLGVVETNPEDYMKQYGKCLIQAKDLPKFVLSICPPEGIKLAANTPAKPIELEGDVDALKLIDNDILVREGLSQYKNI